MVAVTTKQLCFFCNLEPIKYSREENEGLLNKLDERCLKMYCSKSVEHIRQIAILQITTIGITIFYQQTYLNLSVPLEQIFRVVSDLPHSVWTFRLISAVKPPPDQTYNTCARSNKKWWSRSGSY